MKFINKVMAVALSAVVALSIMSIPTKAEAADVTTFTLHADDGKWYFNDSREDSGTWKGLSLLEASMKDGDSIVISGNGNEAGALTTCEITIAKRIGALAASDSATAIVYAKGGCDTAYAVSGGTLVVNGDVSSAMAYNTGVLQVNGNVNELEVFYPNYTMTTHNDPEFGVTGTVGTLKAKVNSQTGFMTIYNVAAGKCVPGDNGILWFDEQYYSKDPASAPAVAPATTPATGEKVLDDVPKTGSTGVATSMAFFAMAAVLAVSAVVVKRKEQ